jgi:DNA-binding GntR family transcriptional regulator
MDIRLLLEPLAAAEAARHCGSAQREVLKAALMALLRALDGSDTSAILTANARLHFAVYRAAERPQLLHVIEGLWLRSGPLLTAVFAPGAASVGDLKSGVAVHERLVEQVIKNDPDAAQEAMQQILQFTRQQFLLRYRFPG